MYVITADQIGSRHDRDRAGEMIAQLTAGFGAGYVLPADQTSGDEIQVMMTDAATALGTILALHRSGHWTIGLGIGQVRTPYPQATRQAAGGAFIAARDAVTRAKKSDARFALDVAPATLVEASASPTPAEYGDRAAGDDDYTGHNNAPEAYRDDEYAPAAHGRDPHASREHPIDGSNRPVEFDAAEVEALLSLLLLLRHRRSREGWEATDLLEQGLPQVEIAGILGISTAAVSQRVKSALWRADEAARPALVRLLRNLNRATSETDPA